MHREPTGAGPGRPDVPPHGWWPSSLEAGDVAGAKVSRGALQAAGDVVTWTESRPAEGGRQVVVAVGPEGGPTDVSPPGVSVRTRVHEYGGVAAVLVGDELLYVDQHDQGLYRWATAGTGPPRVVVPPAPGRRLADPDVAPDGTWSVWVEEVVGEEDTAHRLMVVDHTGGAEPVRLATTTDFVAAPRIDPAGARLAWTGWDHPAMPWDRSVLRVARIAAEGSGGGGRTWTLTDEEVVAGGADSSVGQPRWLADGSLVFADDRTGWWLLYRRPPDGGPAVALVDVAAEFHGPDWVLGQSTVAERSDGSLVARMHAGGRDHLVVLEPPDGDPGRAPWTLVPVHQACVDIAGVAVVRAPSAAAGPWPVGGDTVWVLGSTPELAQCVTRVDPADGTDRATRVVVPAGRGRPDRPAASPRPFVAHTPAGAVPGLVVLPDADTGGDTDDDTDAGGGGSSAGRPPPLVVFCHGGPTAGVQGGFDPVVAFFATRGLAVALVDYRGSSGYGRAYRQSLQGRWGEADRDDCVAYARALARAGLVDGERMAIRGSSAGGLTALRVLQVDGSPFAGAVSWYGVTDLRALLADTHDFESRYLDGLVGPWPEAADRYAECSAITHPEATRGEVLLLQGTDDPVVPRGQAESFAAALRTHGVPCELVLFDGEGHGFRQAATIEACLTAELAFYRRLFGGGGPP